VRARLSPSARSGRHAGFTLLEALLSVALMSAIVFMLSSVSGQWIPNWHHGFGRLQRIELLDLGLQRVVADLQASLFVTPGAGALGPLFDGREASVTLVRNATGPDAAPHLEIVRLAEIVDERGFALVRATAPFTIVPPGAPIDNQVQFGAPVALIRAPFRISFAFAGPDRIWRETWSGNGQLPTAVRVSVRDAATDQTLTASTATLLNVNIAPDCIAENSTHDCGKGVPKTPIANKSQTPAQPAPAGPPGPNDQAL
jgi:general secretion pathway protein J